MNIFFLSANVKKCAKYHCNKHVVKMILEYVQLMSTAWHILDSEQAEEHYENSLICKKSHVNHPCNIWIRQHVNNYMFVGRLALAIVDQWNFRFNHSKIHGCQSKLDFLVANPPSSIPRSNISKTKANPHGFTLPLPQCMPDDCKYKPEKKSFGACIQAYRQCYVQEKSYMAEWYKNQGKEKIQLSPPWWWVD